MVAFLTCDDDLAKYLERRSASSEPIKYSEAWRQDAWHGHDAHLAVLIHKKADGDDIRWLGRVQAGRRVTSRDRSVMITEIHRIEPLATVELRDALSGVHEEAVEKRGILPPTIGAEVLAALLELRPQHADVIRYLSRPAERILPLDERGELLNQERDAVGMLLDMDGIDRGVLRSWSTPAEDAPFLAGMSRYTEREDALISHDIERFGSWVQVPSVRVAWRTFVHGRHRLFVMNANRTPVEHTLGVDVVYYNRERDSFVLVQYKKMRAERAGATEALFYRPDAQLGVELQRMEAIDRLCHAQPGEFRLLATASWLKLCDPDPRIDDTAALIKGMYFAREHFMELMQKCKGPKGGVKIGYSNVPRYLNNTDFTGLVKDGWIGSRGPASGEIKRLVRESLETGHAVAVGVGSRQASMG